MHHRTYLNAIYSPLKCVMTAALAAMLATPEDKQLVNIAEKPATQNQGLCACALVRSLARSGKNAFILSSINLTRSFELTIGVEVRTGSE